MKKHQAIILIMLLIITGNFVYLYPKLDYSPVPTKWGVGIDWGRYYILHEGRIYGGKEFALTWQSDIKNYGSVDVLPKILFATLNLITGTTNFPDDLKLHYTLPWIGVIFLPLVVLFWYDTLCKNEGRKFNYLDCCLLFFFSMFPITSALEPVSGNTNGSGLARSLFLLLLVLFSIIFSKKKKNTCKLSIFLFLLFSFFYYYHTWSYYLAIYLTTILVFAVFGQNNKNIRNLTILGIVGFFMSAIYYNYKLLNEPAMIIRYLPQILVNFPSVSPITKINPEFLGYKPFGSTYSYMQLINAILLLFICLIFFWRYLNLRKRRRLNPHEKILFYFLVAQFFVAGALFVWDGILGVYSRIFESLVYVTMLFAAYLLVKTEGKLKIAIRFMLLSATFLCVIGYLTYPPELNWSLTGEEFIGISFAGRYIPKTSYIFSDFRLGTPLIYFGQLGIRTIDGLHDPPRVTEEVLDRVYYNVSHPATILDKIIGTSEYYVIISSRQAKVYIVDTSLTRFKPASKDFQEKWTKEKSFSKVYSSKHIDIYYRLGDLI